MHRILVLVILMANLEPSFASAELWLVNSEASQIAFRVGYRGGLSLNVVFSDYAAEIDFDPRHPENARAFITVQTASVDSRLAPLDTLIRSADYLSSDLFPTITFDLSGLEKTSLSTANLAGMITVRGITRPIFLRANVYKFDPFNPDPASRVAAFEILGRLDRTEFGSSAGVPQVETLLPIRILLEIHPAS